MKSYKISNKRMKYKYIKNINKKDASLFGPRLHQTKLTNFLTYYNIQNYQMIHIPYLKMVILSPSYFYRIRHTETNMEILPPSLFQKAHHNEMKMQMQILSYSFFQKIRYKEMVWEIVGDQNAIVTNTLLTFDFLYLSNIY